MVFEIYSTEMGSKKKKRGGSGRGKGRTRSGDHTSHATDSNELFAEELTALFAIFQEDCKLVSESPPQIVIKLRPYLKDVGCEDLDVAALLSVRCLPGYPYKCPRVQITPEKGLSRVDADNLLSLLQDQANSNAREGRVMVFNLVEAAQEFLSEIAPDGQSNNVSCSTIGSGCQMFQKEMKVLNDTACSSRGPFVYGFTDIFNAPGKSWWGFGIDDSRGVNSSVHSNMLNVSNVGHRAYEKKLENSIKSSTLQDIKQGPLFSAAVKLGTLEEESEVDSKSISISESSRSLMDNLAGSDRIVETEDLSTEKHVAKEDDRDFQGESSDSLSCPHVVVTDQAPWTFERDLVMVHLLRLACASKGPLAGALPEITTELYNLGIFSEWARDFATKPASLFSKTFDQAFQKHMDSTKLSQFWKPNSDFSRQMSSLPSSRFLSDFEELKPLGHGGFGHVVLCKNKLDGRQYAIKKIPLKDKILPINDRILREVATLSRLQHQHVVRYYQAWFEMGVTGSYFDATLGSITPMSSSFSYKDGSSADAVGHESKVESTFLYIQMEYCPGTLRQVLESYSHLDKGTVWHLFRQIVEGLFHIHGQGIIHRDLTPSNIFFDVRRDVKIGDFGLAKFLRLEQLDQDVGFPADTAGVSVDGTGRVGTYFYTAPEIEQGWPKIDEKVDMYSLGVVFFELWHPFRTAMERHVVLSDLKHKGELPATWVAEFPEQASLVRSLMSSSPSIRPSASELLQHAFPPRMEYEVFDNMLRTMQTSEDTKVYDKVVNAIFDENILSLKYSYPHMTRMKLLGEDTSIQYTDVVTEQRDHVVAVAREVFRLYCFKHLEIIPMRLLDDLPEFNKNTVKLLTHGGDMIELVHELRLPFICWVTRNQRSSYKRYEISYVYRRAIGRSPPNRFLQADFDIIGGAPALMEAEVVKVTVDIVTRFFPVASCDIHLNHGDLLEAIWSWIGVEADHRQKVAELLSLMNSLRPQSPEWKSTWVVVRRQLLQELGLAEAVVNRLQIVAMRFCGSADQALPRLRGALPADKSTRKALDELSNLFSYLRIWRIEKHVYIDALMPPTESYHRDLFFQIYVMKENNLGSFIEGLLVAIGGCYDYLLHQMWDHESKVNSPGAVGTSLALETIIQHSNEEIKPLRNETGISVLICSRGGGGLLEERMELVAELWEENIKAEFVPISDPSLREQYEYASEHDIKCLVIINDTGVSQKNFVKVRHLDLKKDKEVERENLVKFLLDAMATQFRNPFIWN